MSGPINVIRRAIELAETGAYREVQELERQLSREHYTNPHAYLTGQLRKQLATLCRDKYRGKQA
jgi:hypothetical protein